MRIGSTNTEVNSRLAGVASSVSNASKNEGVTKEVQDIKNKQVQTTTATKQENSKEAVLGEQLKKAVDTMNDFLQVQHKASKFVLHEGLGQYFVKLVDSDTEEVIKEIPPERLLDAFYEMQKLAGVIVDEKI